MKVLWFRGKRTSTMNDKELLEVAKWYGIPISELETE